MPQVTAEEPDPAVAVRDKVRNRAVRPAPLVDQDRVSLDASRRAKRHLAETGLVAPDEAPEVSRVLNAAAWTYVAGTLTGILTLLYYLYRLGLIGRRD